MQRKINRPEKTKIYHPVATGSLFATNIITDSVTVPDGNVKNVSPSNADFARDWVDENHL